MTSTTPPHHAPDDALLDRIEAAAATFASSGGEAMAAARSRGLSVTYKTEGKGAGAPTDPVSEVDRAVEERIREDLAARFPGHAVVGEEVDEHPAADAEFTWVIDPVDGTSNFVNGFPLYACSVGVLWRGHPVAGAIWTSTGHALRPGVYHARRGGSLSFDGGPHERVEPHAGLKRRLAAAPGGSPGRARGWDNRVTGSSAIECAFVAAGIFVAAHFRAPAIWDVAGGVVLVEAAGGVVSMRERAGWAPLERFVPPERGKDGRPPSLRDWKQAMILGAPEAVAALTAAERPRGVIQQARQLLLRF